MAAPVSVRASGSGHGSGPGSGLGGSDAIPWAVRYRRFVFAFWVLLALAAAPFAAKVTHNLSANGFEAPHSAAVWADHQSAALRPAPTSPVTLIQDLPSQTTRTLARKFSVPASWLHTVPGGGMLVLAPGSTPAARTAGFLSAVQNAHGKETPIGASELGNALNRDSKQTLEHATALALPILAVLLLVVFGSIGSAILPLIVALFGAELGLAVIDLLESHLTLSVYLTDIATFLALGVGVDYALFISSRFRQALARQGDTADVPGAVHEAMSTSGRSVFFSGLAVAFALGMLALGGTAYWLGLAVGGAVAVFAVLLATHTLLPALLGSLGSGVEWGKISIGRRRTPHGSQDEAISSWPPERGFWGRIAGWATRRSVVFVLLGVALLVGPSVYAPQIHLRVPANLASMLPSNDPLRQASNLEQRLTGPGSLDPAVIALRFPTTVTQPATWQAVARITKHLGALGDVKGVASPTALAQGLPPAQLAGLAGLLPSTARVGAAAGNVRALGENALVRGLRSFINPAYDPHLVVLYVTSKTGPDQAATRALVQELPGKLAAWVPAHTRVGVGGTVALLQGFDAYTDGRLPLIIGGVGAVAFIVLALATGSLLQAFLGVLLDALVAGATAGLLVLTVQHGSLGLSPESPNMAVTPLIFVLLFGLSMDYEVILLHRMQEALRTARSSGEAARKGLIATGGMITGAGLIMVTVFVVLLTSPLEILKTLGIGMSCAILLDTWIVRSLLVPGLTTLFGPHAFWPWGGKPGRESSSVPESGSSLV